MAKDNRFLRLGRGKQIVIITASLLLLFVLSEICAWLLCLSVYKLFHKEIVPLEMINNFHPLLKRNPKRYQVISEFQFSPYILYKRRPNVLTRDGFYWETDKYGFTINNPSQLNRDLDHKSGRYRIFILGGSTIEGRDSRTTLASFIEQALNAGKGMPKYEVISAGASGYNSAQELILAVTELIYYYPDMIITFDGINDANYSIFLENNNRNGHSYAEDLKRHLDKEYFDSYKLNLRFNKRFLKQFYTLNILTGYSPRVLVNLLKSKSLNYLNPQASYQYSNIKFNKEGVAVYLENLKSMSAVLGARKIKCVHILQPTLTRELFQRGNDPANIKAINIVGPDDDENTKIKIEVISKYFAAAEECFNAQAKLNSNNTFDVWLDYTDCFKEVKDLSTVYLDYMHYSNPNTKKIGERIAEDIKKIEERGSK